VNLKRPFSPFKSPLLFYPPAYPYFLGVCHAFLGGLRSALWLQALLGALLVPAVGFTGARAFGMRVGLLAAAGIAFYPDLVWFAAHFWSETLFMLLVWWGIERLLAADDASSGGEAPALVGGILWGLAALTRETILPFVPAAALALAWRRDVSRMRGLRRGAAFGFGALVTIAPWTWRNWVVFGAFIPVSTFGALNLWQGNTTLPREEVYRQSDSEAAPVAQYRLARARAIDAILARQPRWILEKLASEMPPFWSAGSEAIEHIDRGAYGSVRPAVIRIAKTLVLGPYLALLPFFLLGAAVRLERPQRLLVWFLVGYAALHVVASAQSRYRLPVLPVLMLLAAHAVVLWHDGQMRASLRGREWLLALLGAGLVVTLAAG
jgi:hypothetical protein